MNLLLDQGLPRSTAHILRESGMDAVHVGEIGLSTASDSEIIQRARDEDRIVVTLDAGFHALLAVSGASSPSVIRIRIEGLDGVALGQLLNNVTSTLAPGLGVMVTVQEKRVRIRQLPLT